MSEKNRLNKFVLNSITILPGPSPLTTTLIVFHPRSNAFYSFNKRRRKKRRKNEKFYNVVLCHYIIYSLVYPTNCHCCCLGRNICSFACIFISFDTARIRKYWLTFVIGKIDNSIIS